MLFRLIGTTIILGAITGFADSSEGEFSRRRGGQIVQGVFSISSFILVGVAYWRFGWKIDLIYLLFVIISFDIVRTVLRYLSKKDGWCYVDKFIMLVTLGTDR